MKKTSSFLFFYFVSILMLFSQTEMVCGSESSEVSEESESTTTSTTNNVCSLNPSRYVDYGNKFFVPDENSEILDVKVNIWVFTHPLLFDGTAEPVSHFTSNTSDPDFENQFNYLASLPAKANERVYANANLDEICLDGNPTGGPASLDTKIRLVLNTKENGSPAIYYVNDLSAATSGGNTGFTDYISSNGLYDDAINIVFVQSDASPWSGAAFGITSPATTHIKINGGFGRYQAGWLNLEGQNFAHEFNHILGLGHTHEASQIEMFDYECIYECVTGSPAFNSPLNHNMSCRGQNQKYLSPLQSGYLRRMLTTTFRSRFLSHPPLVKETITIDGYEVIDPGLHWNGDIVINEGGVLEVLGTLALTEDSRIFVKRGAKLIVNGGTITSCGEDSKWAGIFVEGGFLKSGVVQLDHPSAPTNASFAGTVWLKNEALISYAKNAITTNNSHLGWPAVKDYWGGLIWSEGGSRFEDCGRAVEIMKYGTQFIPDKSRFINTNFGRLKNGVTIWASDGVRFEGCNFENIEFSAIGPYNAQVFIENGNNFEDTKIAVDITGTAVKSYELKVGNGDTESNTFDNTEIGIQAFSVLNTVPMIVENNIFENDFDTKRGVFVFGNSKFEIRKNDFGNIFNGVRVRSTSQVEDLDNRIVENEFNRPFHSVVVVKDNMSVKIIDNCFNSFINSIFIGTSGRLPIQGSLKDSPTIEAGNCLETGKDILNTNENFVLEYLLMPGRPEGSCEIPNFFPSIPDNIVIVDAEIYNPDRLCGTNFQEIPPNQFGPCNTEVSLVTLKNNVSAFDEELEGFEGPSYMERQIKYCRADHLNEIYSRYMGEENYMDAFQYFSERPSFFYRTYALSALLNGEEYSTAHSYLENSIAANSFAETDYVEAQLIQLDYLENMLDYELSEDDYYFLKNSALSADEYGGVIASVFKFITGEQIEFPETPESEGGSAEENSSADSKDNLPIYDLKLHPNPSSQGFLHIECPSNVCDVLEIRSLVGNLLLNVNVESDFTKINTHSLPAGIYIVSAMSNGSVWKSQRLVVTR